MRSTHFGAAYALRRSCALVRRRVEHLKYPPLAGMLISCDSPVRSHFCGTMSLGRVFKERERLNNDLEQMIFHV